MRSKTQESKIVHETDPNDDWRSGSPQNRVQLASSKEKLIIARIDHSVIGWISWSSPLVLPEYRQKGWTDVFRGSLCKSSRYAPVSSAWILWLFVYFQAPTDFIRLFQPSIWLLPILYSNKRLVNCKYPLFIIRHLFKIIFSMVTPSSPLFLLHRNKLSWSKEMKYSGIIADWNFTIEVRFIMWSIWVRS